MDGDIDYTPYTRAQLEEALTRIDGRRYPANLANLQRALSDRPLPAAEVVASASSKHRRWLRWLNLLGGLQLVSVGFLLALVLPLSSRLMAMGAAGAVIAVAFAFLITVNAASGFGTVLGRPLGYRLNVLNNALQILSVSSGAFSYEYRAIGGIGVDVAAGPVLTLGSSVGSAMLVSLESDRTLGVGINFFAIGLVVAYAWALGAQRRGVTAS